VNRFLPTEVRPFSFRRAAKTILKPQYPKFKVTSYPAKQFMEISKNIKRVPKLEPVGGVPNLLQDKYLMPYDVFVVYWDEATQNTCHKDHGVLQKMWPPRKIADGSMNPGIKGPYDLEYPWGLLLHDPVSTMKLWEVPISDTQFRIWLAFTTVGIFGVFPLILFNFQINNGVDADLIEVIKPFFLCKLLNFDVFLGCSCCHI
jgi:hypothetical protein